jgi:hypothetical protein
MEKSKFDGKAIEALDQLVEHHENEHERSGRPSSDAEDHGRAHPSEEEKRVP